MDYEELISINPKIRFGKPCITGTRIAVADVLAWLTSGMNEKEITKDFSQVKRKHILACLKYAAEENKKLMSLFPNVAFP